MAASSGQGLLDGDHSPNPGSEQPRRCRLCCFRRQKPPATEPRSLQVSLLCTSTESFSFLITHTLESVQAAINNDARLVPGQVALSDEEQKRMEEVWSLWANSKQEEALATLQRIVADFSESSQIAVKQDSRFERLTYQCNILRKMDGYMELSPQPFDAVQLSTQNWMDCSTPGIVQCLAQIEGDTPPGGHTITVIVSADSVENMGEQKIMCSVPSTLHPGRRMLQSPLAFFNEVSLWPQWFPGCLGTTVLQEWSNMEAMYYMKFGMFGVKGDMVVYTIYRLCFEGENPYLESVSGSPPVDATTFLGVSVPPPVKGFVRIVKPFQRVRCYPLTWNSWRIVAINQDVLTNRRAIHWLIRRIWIALSSRLGRMLAGKFKQFINNGEGVSPECEPHVLRQQKLLEELFLKLQDVLGPPADGFGAEVLQQNPLSPSLGNPSDV